jgi:hypothetical protein
MTHADDVRRAAAFCTSCRDDLAALLREVRAEAGALALAEAEAEVARWRDMEHKLGAAYLRLRTGIGQKAFDTPHAPTGEQVWETTERALQLKLNEIGALQAEVARLRGALEAIAAMHTPRESSVLIGEAATMVRLARAALAARPEAQP